jgi:hypothetical protein
MQARNASAKTQAGGYLSRKKRSISLLAFGPRMSA